MELHFGATLQGRAVSEQKRFFGSHFIRRGSPVLNLFFIRWNGSPGELYWCFSRAKTVLFWKKKRAVSNLFLGVIFLNFFFQKEGWMSYPSILLLVWQRLRTLGTFSRIAAPMSKLFCLACYTLKISRGFTDDLHVRKDLINVWFHVAVYILLKVWLKATTGGPS